MELKFLKGYSDDLIEKVKKVIEEGKLKEVLKKKYPNRHNIIGDKELYEYTIAIKNQYIKNSSTISKVIYSNKIEFTNQALGLHTYRPVKQGKKIKMKNEIRISSNFRYMPETFLRHIVIHELAHLKEKNHDKAFYKLCMFMEPDYSQIEFDMRLAMTYQELYKENIWKNI